MDNKNKTVVITGGLSGMGKATAYELSKKGYTVIIFDVVDNKANEVINECEKLGGKAAYIHCDLSKKEEIDKAFEEVKTRFGHLDCAFNNAGISIASGPLHTITEEAIDKMIAIDLKAVMICMINELQLMKENGFGRIVNNSSASGLMGNKHSGIYNACKFGVNGLTRSAALDYAQENITINAVAPGTMGTEFLLGFKETAPELFAEWEKINPIGRLGEPWEVARVVSFLMEEDSKFINGAVISVDSGLTAGM